MVFLVTSPHPHSSLSINSGVTQETQIRWPFYYLGNYKELTPFSQEPGTRASPFFLLNSRMIELNVLVEEWEGRVRCCQQVSTIALNQYVPKMNVNKRLESVVFYWVLTHFSGCFFVFFFFVPELKRLCALLYCTLKILLEYSYFTTYYFLLYNKLNQLYVYIYPLLLGFSSHIGHHRALCSVPSTIQEVLVS